MRSRKILAGESKAKINEFKIESLARLISESEKGWVLRLAICASSAWIASTVLSLFVPIPIRVTPGWSHDVPIPPLTSSASPHWERIVEKRREEKLPPKASLKT